MEYRYHLGIMPPIDTCEILYRCAKSYLELLEELEFAQRTPIPSPRQSFAVTEGTESGEDSTGTGPNSSETRANLPGLVATASSMGLHGLGLRAAGSGVGVYESRPGNAESELD